MAKVKKEKKADAEESTSILGNKGELILKFLPTILTVGILVLFFVLILFIDNKVKDSENFQFNQDSLHIGSNLPDWIIKEKLVAKIRLHSNDVKEAYLGKSFFDRVVVNDLRGAFLKSPWLKDAIIEKKYPNQISVIPKFRRPIAAFLLNNTYWYVLDEDGVILPIVEKVGSEQLNVIRIKGVTLKSIHIKPGMKLNISSVKKSIGLIKLFANEYNLPKNLDSIEIKDMNHNKNSFNLVFKNGLEVNWGDFLFENEYDGFPGKQLSSSQKVQLFLDQVNEQPNRLHIDVEFKP